MAEAPEFLDDVGHHFSVKSRGLVSSQEAVGHGVNQRSIANAVPRATPPVKDDYLILMMVDFVHGH
jgi:hypothetical protein